MVETSGRQPIRIVARATPFRAQSVLFRVEVAPLVCANTAATIATSRARLRTTDRSGLTQRILAALLSELAIERPEYIVERLAIPAT